jgi:hypothetical protein
VKWLSGGTDAVKGTEDLYVVLSISALAFYSLDFLYLLNQHACLLNQIDLMYTTSM